MYTHLYLNHGQITDGDLKEARRSITEQFDFATQPLEQYLLKMPKAQQLHGNVVLVRHLADVDAMGIVYLNLQRSGLYPLDCRE